MSRPVRADAWRGAHAGRLERWLGVEACEALSAATRDWYGPPIAVGRVPGLVYAAAGGDLVGPVRGGGHASAVDWAVDRLAAQRRRWERAQVRAARRQRDQFHAGFASLSDLIAEMTAGKQNTFQFQKVGTTGVVAATNSLWRVGNQPAAGAAAAAAPGGTVPTDATTGSWPFTNPTGGDTQHLVRMDSLASVGGNTLLLYDRIFAVAKTMNSTATEAVTGVPTRYQAASGADYAAGNFLFIECGTALPATAHNWTTCTYTDQDGNAGATLPSVTGNSSNIVNRLDQPTSRWFCPLASGDTGIKALTQMQCSALVATGAIDFVIGHPIAFCPQPLANFGFVLDGINSAINLVRIFDDACLALLEICKSATNATTYTGQVATAYG